MSRLSDSGRGAALCLHPVVAAPPRGWPAVVSLALVCAALALPRTGRGQTAAAPGEVAPPPAPPSRGAPPTGGLSSAPPGATNAAPAGGMPGAPGAGASTRDAASAPPGAGASTRDAASAPPMVPGPAQGKTPTAAGEPPPSPSPDSAPRPEGVPASSAGPSAPTASTTWDGAPGGTGVAVLSRGHFVLRLACSAQVDAVLYSQSSQDELNPSTGAPLNETRFVLRRGRVRSEASLGWAGLTLELDVNTVDGVTSRPILVEAQARWRGPTADAPPYLVGSIGLMSIPFGGEVPLDIRSRFFQERTHVTRALFPGQWDLGAKVVGGWRFLRYAFAVMNGEPIGEQGFSAQDPNRAKDLLGRIGIQTGLGHGIELSAGFSALMGKGFHRGAAGTKDQLVWRDVNEDGLVQLTEIQTIAGAAAEPSVHFARSAVGGDFRLRAAIRRLGQLVVSGELILAKNLDRGLSIADPVAIGRDLREVGWLLSASQELPRGWALGVRYDRYNPDADATDRQGAQLVPKDPTFSALTVAAAWSYGAVWRLVLEYEHNGNALGRSQSGQPTSLGTDRLTFRTQAVF